MKRFSLSTKGEARASALPSWIGALALSAFLAACGSGSDSSGTAAQTPPTQEAAARFLTQASFGPDDASVSQVQAQGYSRWIDTQLALPVASHVAAWDAADAEVKKTNAAASVGQDGVINSFWKQALAGEGQLRQRVAYALSQIFVVSMQDGNVGENPRTAASYLDMLADKGVGNYRDLLEAVALHPAMGVYLSHLRNQKADPRTGRVPDENFARPLIENTNAAVPGSVAAANAAASRRKAEFVAADQK